MAEAVSPGSALERLRATRGKQQEDLHVDLRLPHVDAPIFVRYRPFSQSEMESIPKKMKGSKNKDKTVLGHAMLLVEACRGVIVFDEDGEPVGIDPDEPGDWPRFDDRLADLIGLEAGSAADLVRRLYRTDGHVISTVNKVAEFSGYGDPDEDEDESGN